jgi:Keratinocyte-associated gene product
LPANAVEIETTKNATQVEVKETVQSKPVTQAAAPVVVNKSADTAATKPETVKTDLLIGTEDEPNLEDKDIFDEQETQSDLPSEKDMNDLNVDADDDDDPDADYPPAELTRDNNRNNIQNNNRLNLAEVEAPETVRMDVFEEDPDSNFFTYLCIVMFLSILLYILYHNRQKILGLLIEGRRGSRRQRERSRSGSKAAYSKLDCNLEEAITSKKSLSGKSMDIIY